MIIIKDKSKCVGCFSCFNICPQKCIKMTMDNEGFYYPEVDKDSCINCNLCIKHCPLLNKKEDNKYQNVAYACKNKDKQVRSDSSSGGVFSLLAEYVIENNGIVCGASFNSNWQVKHIIINNKQDIPKLRKSKYVQSMINNNYLDIKNELLHDRLVLFSGTPCQIAGLYACLGKKYDNLICQDIICHGVPSLYVWDKYLKERTVKNGNDIITDINFRDKRTGWSYYSLSIKFLNSKYNKVHKNDPYMKLFLENIDLRPSCYNCAFKSLNKLSDLTLGDFWKINNVIPEFNDNKGVTFLIINSDKGNLIFNCIKDKLELRKLNGEISRYNTALVTSVIKPIRRENFFKIIKQTTLKEYVKENFKESIFKILIRRIKYFLVYNKYILKEKIKYERK